MSPPVIAVAGRRRPAAVGGHHGGVEVPAPYLRALHRAGARDAVLAPVDLDPEDGSEPLRGFGGLLLIGGGDVHPARYGEERHPSVYGVDPERDAFEAALVCAAAAVAIPTLAICRGVQVVNVALGGTLVQHLEGHGDPGAGRPVARRIRLEPGSRAAAAMGTEVATGSCHHHQGLARLAEGLLPVAWADDGLVEAVEHRGGWLIGVQWHPEETADRDAAQQGLFDTLVREAARRSTRGP